MIFARAGSALVGRDGAALITGRPAPELVLATNYGASSAASTGDMVAASNQLTLADASAFPVGCFLIVEVGGEAGAGARGTVGVGGTWPRLRFANAAAMEADATRPNSMFCWTQDDGLVYRRLAGTWELFTGPDPAESHFLGNYYTGNAAPRALLARVVSKAGNVLMLTEYAVAATTGANVYIDNTNAFNHMFRDGSSGHAEAFVANGDYAISDVINTIGLNHWILRGESRENTRIFMPKGVFHQRFFYCGTGMFIRDITFEDNYGDDGYGTGATETDVPAGLTYPYGLVFFQADGGKVLNTTFKNFFQAACAASDSRGIDLKDVKVELDCVQRAYMQWQFNFSNCTDCVADGFEGDFLAATSAMEAFVSTGVSFRNIVVRNGVFSSNASTDVFLESMDFTIEAGCAGHPGGSFSVLNPVININTNTGTPPSPQAPTRAFNISVIQEGYVDADDNILRGFVVNTQNENVSIFDSDFVSPDYSVSSTFAWLGGAVESTGPDAYVENVSASGAVKVGKFNIYVTDGAVKNCTAGAISAPYVT